MYAYLDDENNVIATSTQAFDISSIPDAVTRIDEAPVIGLIAMRSGLATYHKKTSGDGSVLSDYDLVDNPDGYQQVADLLNSKAPVIDSYTNIMGTYLLMQVLLNRREIYNDEENPLYLAGHIPLLGPTGSVTNLNNIHSKDGWHNTQVQSNRYLRPKNLLIYYGYPSGFNAHWDNELVAQDMARMGLIVLGNGLENPSHPDYANTSAIIARVKALNPSALIFGYVSTNQVLSTFESKVDQWEVLQVHGIFMDESGYDYGKTRAEFNERVDYVHGKTYAKLAFANAWKTDNILGTTNDASFPNTTYNPDLLESALTSNDWILLESFGINTTAYSSENGYEGSSQWSIRASKAISLRAQYLVNFAGVGIINDDNANGQDLFDFGFISALMCALEAFGTSDTSYGSSSGKANYWSRPTVAGLTDIYTMNPAVQIDINDSDVYHRFMRGGHAKLDFSSGAQLSDLTIE